MQIKIIRHVPTNPSPETGKVYEVVRINKRTMREGGDVRFVICQGIEVGVLGHECQIVKEEEER